MLCERKPFTHSRQINTLMWPRHLLVCLQLDGKRESPSSQDVPTRSSEAWRVLPEMPWWDGDDLGRAGQAAVKRGLGSHPAYSPWEVDKALRAACMLISPMLSAMQLGTCQLCFGPSPLSPMLSAMQLGTCHLCFGPSPLSPMLSAMQLGKCHLCFGPSSLSHLLVAMQLGTRPLCFGRYPFSPMLSAMQLGTCHLCFGPSPLSHLLFAMQLATCHLRFGPSPLSHMLFAMQLGTSLLWSISSGCMHATQPDIKPADIQLINIFLMSAEVVICSHMPISDWFA